MPYRPIPAPAPLYFSQNIYTQHAKLIQGFGLLHSAFSITGDMSWWAALVGGAMGLYLGTSDSSPT